MLFALSALALVAAPTPLTSVAQLKALCGDLRSPPGPGSKRKAARATEWVAQLAPGQFTVGSSEARDGTLTLSTAGGFHLFDGHALLTPVDDDDFDLSLAAGQAEPADPEALALELVFRPGVDAEPPCTQGLVADVAMGIEVLSLKLLDKAGHTVAFLDSDVLSDRPTPAGGKPEVDVDPAQVEGSPSASERLTDALQGIRPQLLACFEHALTATPTLDGLLVLSFPLGRDGKPGKITVVADSLQDDGMTACVLERVRALAAKGGKGKKVGGESSGGRSSVTLRFERH